MSYSRGRSQNEFIASDLIGPRAYDYVYSSPSQAIKNANATFTKLMYSKKVPTMLQAIEAAFLIDAGLVRYRAALEISKLPRSDVRQMAKYLNLPESNELFNEKRWKGTYFQKGMLTENVRETMYNNLRKEWADAAQKTVVAEIRALWMDQQLLGMQEFADPQSLIDFQPRSLTKKRRGPLRLEDYPGLQGYVNSINQENPRYGEAFAKMLHRYDAVQAFESIVGSQPDRDLLTRKICAFCWQNMDGHNHGTDKLLCCDKCYTSESTRTWVKPYVDTIFMVREYNPNTVAGIDEIIDGIILRLNGQLCVALTKYPQYRNVITNLIHHTWRFLTGAHWQAPPIFVTNRARNTLQKRIEDSLTRERALGKKRMIVQDLTNTQTTIPERPFHEMSLGKLVNPATEKPLDINQPFTTYVMDLNISNAIQVLGQAVTNKYSREEIKQLFDEPWAKDISTITRIVNVYSTMRYPNQYEKMILQYSQFRLASLRNQLSWKTANATIK